MDECKPLDDGLSVGTARSTCVVSGRAFKLYTAGVRAGSSGRSAKASARLMCAAAAEDDAQAGA